MATNTTNYSLKKPAQDDFYNVDDFNNNADIIDTAIKQNADDIVTAEAEVKEWAGETFSNPNLLINADFKNAVNQRGRTSYVETTGTSNIFTIDRWKAIGSTVAPSSSGLNVAKYTGLAHGGIAYYSDDIYSSLYSETLTFSIDIDGETQVLTGLFSTTIVRFDFDNGYMYFYKPSANSRITIAIFFTDENTHVITWAKLELGSAATPFVPRPYGEELALCKRYFERIGGPQSGALFNGHYQSPTHFAGAFTFAPKRIVGATITFTDVSNYSVYSNGTAQLISVISASAHDTSDRAIVDVTVPSGGSTGYGGLVQRTDAATAAYIDIDAEIY